MRIKLDLSDFLEDERKLVVLSVNEEESRTVRDVLAKIIKLFKLSPWHQDADIVHSKKLDLGLFEEEFFIHPDETSSVLHGIGLLKLKTLPSSQEAEGKKKKKGKKKAKEEEESVNETVKEKRKRNASPDVLPPQRREERRERRIKLEDVISTSEGDSNDREGTLRKRKRASTAEEESSIEESRGRRKSKRSKFSKLETNFCDVNESKKHGISNRDLLTESESESEQLMILGRTRNDPYLVGGSFRGKSRKDTSSLQSSGRSNDFEKGTDIKWKKKTKVIEEFEIDGDELQELYSKKGTKGQQIEFGFEESRGSKRNRFQNLAVDYELGKSRSKKKSGERDNIIEKQKELERRYLEDKKSQVKVVSTSTVINLLSDDSLDDASTDKSEKTLGERLSNIRSYEQDDGPHAADSVTDPSACFEPCGPLKTGKKKRIRKHKKKKRNEQQSVVENDTPYGNIAEKSVFDRDVAYNFPFEKPRSTKQGMQLVVNQGKHVFFESEDEIVSSNERGRSSSAHDVEVVATASNIFRKESQHSEQSSRKESFRQTRQRLTEPVVVEIEGESTLPSSSSVFAPSRYQTQRRQIPSFSDRQVKKHKNNDSDTLYPGQNIGEVHLGEKFKYSTPVMKKKPPVQVQDDECVQMLHSEDYPSVDNKAISHPSQPSDDTDDLATFKRMCENTNLMVVKVDPRRRLKAKPQERETNKTGNTLNLGPPSPSDHSTVDVTEESRQSFHNLTVIENRDMPLIIPRSRRSLRGSEEKSLGERKTEYANAGNNVDREDCSQSGNGTCTEVPQSLDSINSLQDRRDRSKSCDIIENNMERTQPNNPSNSNSSSMDTNSKLSPKKPEFGMHSHYRKKNRPRVFQSVGAVLANLKYSSEEGREPIAEPTTGRGKVHEAALEQNLSQAEVHASYQSSNPHKDFSTESNDVLKENVKQTDGSGAVDDDDDIVHLESDEEEHAVQTRDVVPETLDVYDIIEERRERMQGIAELGKLGDVQKHQEMMFSEQFKNIPGGVMEGIPEGYRGFPEILAKVLGGGISVKQLVSEQETVSHRENECISKDSVKERLEVTLDDEQSNQHVLQSREDTSKNRVHNVPEEANDVVPENRENLILERRKNEDLGEISEVVSGEIKEKGEEVVLDEVHEEKKRSPLKDDLCITKEVQEKVVQKIEDEEIKVVVDDDTNVQGDLNNDRAVVNENDDCRSEVKVLPETEDSAKGMKDDMKKTKMEIIELAKSAEDDDFEKFPLMESAPRVGELIALKVVSLDEGYRPVYSNYVKAQILAVKGWKIKLRYIDDVESVKKGDKDEVADVEEVDLTSDDEEQDDLIEVLDWRDIHAPRLLYP